MQTLGKPPERGPVNRDCMGGRGAEQRSAEAPFSLGVGSTTKPQLKEKEITTTGLFPSAAAAFCSAQCPPRAQECVWIPEGALRR